MAFVQQRHCGHDLARGAVAALEGVVLDERGLDGVELIPLRQALNGRDLSILLHVYEVTAAAVRAALPQARVGGPATTGELGPGRAGNQFLRDFLAYCAREAMPLDFVSFHTKGAHFSPWRVYGPLGGPPPQRQSPSSLKMLREVRAALRTVAEQPRFRDLPCIVDERDASVPAHWGVYDNANFGYRNTEYYPVFQCKLMKKLLDLDQLGLARAHQAERKFKLPVTTVTAKG